MIVAAIAIGGLGILAALALGVAAKVFYVEVDPLITEIEGVLPGANCGGCGQAGCSGAAAAIARGIMPPNGCVAGGADVASAVAAILGVEVKETEPEIAQVGCRYPVQRADIKFKYDGLENCRAAFLLHKGPKECPVGCIGLGSCVKACPFDAMSMGPDNLPVVDESKCTGCGTCVRTCPAGIMQLTSVTDRILNEYSWDECTAPCQRRCPAGINIPEQIRQTSLGNYDAALRVIKERNPLPLICGRICPNPCELVCRRNLVDEPVAINPLKRFVADYERTSGKRQQPFKAPATGRRAAIVGGGVEGLSAAFFLARLGHSPKIFEARDKLGGLLRTVIPESRLPRDVLDWEIEGILEMGVEAQTNCVFGRDISISSLFEDGYESILFSVGGWDAMLNPGKPVVPAPALPDIYLLLPLTMAWAAGQDIRLGGKVVLIGCSREVLRAAKAVTGKGAASVTVLCPGPADRMGIGAEEVKALYQEGITVMPNARVTGLMGVGDRLTHLNYTISASKAMIAGGGMNEEEYSLDADTIIVAGGRIPDMIVQREKGPDGNGETEEQAGGGDMTWRTVMPYPTSERLPDMFAARENVSDHWAAVEAIGAGRRAATTMHLLFTGEEIAAPKDDLCRGPQLFAVDQLVNLLPAGPRQEMPEAAQEQRLNTSQEIELGFDEASAKAEARRCLNCGLICYYRTKYN